MDLREHGGAASSVVAASIIYTLELASIVFVLFWLAYVAVANAVLAYGVDRIIGRPDVHVHYTSAHSYWPGVIEIEDLSVAQQVATVEWSLAARHARVRLDVGELLAKMLHVRHFEADGFSYRLRLRLTRDEADQRATRALPPIAPFDDPPLVAFDAPPAPSRSSWTFIIDDSDVAVDEIWIHHVRFVGHARSRGGFAVQARRFIRVGPASLDVADGEVTIGSYRAAHALSGRLEFLLDPTDPSADKALQAFRSMSAHASLDGVIDGIEPLELFLDRVRVEDGSGGFSLDARVQNGILLEDSTLAYASRAVAVSFDPIGVRAAGDLAVLARVESARDAQRIVVEARLPPASIVRAGVDAKAGRVDAARLSFIVEGADLTGDDHFGGAKLDIPRARMPDARLIDPLRDDLPRPLTGEATASLHAEVDRRWRGSATVDTSALKARVRWGAFTIAFDGTSHVDVEDLDLIGRSASLSGDGDLIDVAITHGGKTTSSLWTRYRVAGKELSLRGEGPAFDLRVKGHLNDAAPLVEVFAPSKPAAWATRLLGLHASDYDLAMTEQDRAFVLRLGATAGALKGQGAMRFAHGERRGAFLLEDGPISIGVDVTQGGGGVEALADRAWLAKRLATLAPTSRPAP